MKHEDNTQPEFFEHWTKEQMVEELVRLNRLLIEINGALADIRKLQA